MLGVEQLGLFASPPRLFTCTPSKLGSYEDCPRRYRFTYVDRPAPPKGAPWAHNSLGASVHTALKNWYALEPDRRRPEVLPTLLKATWVREGYKDDNQEREVYRRALGWLESYVDTLDPQEDPVGVERTVAARTETLALSGRVDRIDQRGAELVIVDYKTGRNGVSEDEARGSRALALYAIATARVFRKPCHRVELHHLPTGTVAAFDHTDASLDRHLRRAEATAADILADAEFAPRPGAQCSWCDYRKVCPEGSTSPARDPWTAVERGPGDAVRD
ncbi:RecB family exonuclease [Dactylosporangium sp. CS-033363]|uniref:RecB family exonuclease n=1 Tax=Dactylosporangium sp. CS-033363 TaxID=3239935 RepID=UPI003D8F5223